MENIHAHNSTHNVFHSQQKVQPIVRQNHQIHIHLQDHQKRSLQAQVNQPISLRPNHRWLNQTSLLSVHLMVQLH